MEAVHLAGARHRRLLRARPARPRDHPRRRGAEPGLAGRRGGDAAVRPDSDGAGGGWSRSWSAVATRRPQLAHRRDRDPGGHLRRSPTSPRPSAPCSSCGRWRRACCGAGATSRSSSCGTSGRSSPPPSSASLVGRRGRGPRPGAAAGRLVRARTSWSGGDATPTGCVVVFTTGSSSLSGLAAAASARRAAQRCGRALGARARGGLLVVASRLRSTWPCFVVPLAPGGLPAAGPHGLGGAAVQPRRRGAAQPGRVRRRGGVHAARSAGRSPPLGPGTRRCWSPSCSSVWSSASGSCCRSAAASGSR